ncbi:MAG: hypothetical protein ACFFD8_03080 [Candidatus Thorarchaeota archaeon]
MVFCPIARGYCCGRINCRLWIRGRILNTDSKFLAAELAQFSLQHHAQTNPRLIAPEISKEFWENQGIPNIYREIIIDRYLREKVTEVEEQAIQWVQSLSVHQKVPCNKQTLTKDATELHVLRCKSLP